MAMRGWLGFALLVAVLRTQAAEAQVEACVDSMPDAEVVSRLAAMEESFVAQRPGAIAWWTGWTTFNVFNIAYGTYQSFAGGTRLDRDSWFVSVIGAGIFVAGASVFPLPGMYAKRRFSRWPRATPEQRRATLKRSYALLEQAAHIESISSNWIARTIAWVYAVGSTAYVWARNTDAPSDRLALAVVLQFVTSVGVAELTFWSVPRRARRDDAVLQSWLCEPGFAEPRSVSRRPHPPKRAPLEALGVTILPGQLAVRARF